MKILIVLTNVSQYGNSSQATGLWLSEVTDFIKGFQNSEFDIEYASPKGGVVPLDPRSLKIADRDSLDLLSKDTNFTRALKNSMPIKEAIMNKYDLIYFAGGHGAMWDFYNNIEIEKLVINNYQQGGYIASICHGIAALLSIKHDSSEYLISNKRITGFTDTEELLSSKKFKVPFSNERVAKFNGAIFVKKRFFKSNVVVDGQLITGQNFKSVLALAKISKKLMTNK
ncbi:type 1 glutamine amidotransferase domain-containing protein [Mesoplasma syrphidae]|uniref:Type 1 glutamine amidotransferase domain-containing protein n=1 Tax=Mesoplasma syrphidae TaxID=225999 RepID=A0A2K9C5L0_9MOLU|nr:type 1 glutamine amidotransferase domain-containing protein [Mesoplasma syrphidae]AUF83577.1 type 1 glutamine amidotransferase domain-containing protein [Mesoplasma syrphidae]